MLTFDYETEGIVGNPIYNPPKPVGVSIKFNGEGSRYLAWGHPTNNNCTFDEGKRSLIEALRRDPEWLAHNGPFEAAITRKYFGISKGNARNFHDTQYLIFLHDPYAATFSLKPSAERILGLAPDEQTELRDWILRHVPQATLSTWGAYICLAPGDLVGKYAGDSANTGAPGDTDRTWLLYQKLAPLIRDRGMWPAYQREQDLMPILTESSRRGVRVDTQTLERDIGTYRKAQKVSDDYIFSRLGEFDIGKDAQLAEALDRAGLITDWVLTLTGKRSVARKNLVGRVKDPGILTHLSYRNVLETCLGTFAGPWLDQALREGGRVHPQWNQVRGDRGVDGDISGTRTGRMSCKQPNLQNPPNDFEDLVIPEGQLPMMHMRKYLLPEEGHTWLKRDFSAQEMRILAHYTEGALANAFRDNPSTDPHVSVRDLILRHSGIELSRKFVKITGFGIMYGRGIDNLSAALGVGTIQGKATRDAYFAALPEVRELSRSTKTIGSSGKCIVTWGGREYYREPNPTRDMSYKLLNYLIQGSAADQTKQTAIDWVAVKPRDHHLIALVHDEANISVPIGQEKSGMKILREAMDVDRFDVPFRSEGYFGKNWSQLEKYHD
jgi:DNA polymerase I